MSDTHLSRARHSRQDVLDRIDHLQAALEIKLDELARPGQVWPGGDTGKRNQTQPAKSNCLRLLRQGKLLSYAKRSTVSDFWRVQ